MKYYVNVDGSYIGAFGPNPDGSYTAPDGGIEVPFAPVDAAHIWDSGTQEWNAPPRSVSDLHAHSNDKAYEARHETWAFSPTQPGSQSGEVTCMANGKFAVDISLIVETALSKPNKIYKGVDAGTPPKSFSLKGGDVYVTGDEELPAPVTVYGQILKRRESISTVEADVADGINDGTITTYAGIDAAYS